MISVRHYPKRPRTKEGKLKDTPVSLYTRISKSRKERVDIDPDEKIIPAFWDFKRQRVKGRHHDADLVNNHLSDLERKYATLYRENRDKTWDEFKALCQGKGEKKTLREAIEKFIQYWGEGKSEGTVKRIRALQSHLFGKARGADARGKEVKGYEAKLDFADINMEFYYKFRKFLWDKGCIDSTTYKIISHLKHVLRWATDSGYPVNPIFNKFEIVSHDPEPIALTEDELEKLETADLTGNLAIGRDFLCFECRTGQRISDVKRFDLKDFDPETLEWTFTMKKGDSMEAHKQTVIFDGFCGPALDILERHNFRWPKVPEQKINKWIKLAAEKVGITHKIEKAHWSRGNRIVESFRKCDLISTHTGRKTFITLTLGHFYEHDVMTLSGIRSSKTLKHYKAKPEAKHLRAGLVKMVNKAV